jgi:hypothetical protein
MNVLYEAYEIGSVVSDNNTGPAVLSVDRRITVFGQGRTVGISTHLGGVMTPTNARALAALLVTAADAVDRAR